MVVFDVKKKNRLNLQCAIVFALDVNKNTGDIVLYMIDF